VNASKVILSPRWANKFRVFVHPNEKLITDFYAAFQSHDAERMIAVYDSKAVFTDPAFGRLQASRLFAMWRMLCARASDLEIRVSDVHADDAVGSAKWEADYTFGMTKRRVHNVIQARFVFNDGKIVRHTDAFDMWKWSGMAIGLPGRLLGWFPPFQSFLRKNFTKQLQAYIDKQVLTPSA